MSSLRPREGGSIEPPYRPVQQKLPFWIPAALVVLVLGLAGVAYTQYDAKTGLQKRVSDLELRLDQDIEKLKASDTAIASDVEVVTKRVGVTGQELASARNLAEKLRQEHEAARQALEAKLASKADSEAVEANVAAARAEAASKVAEVQKESDTRISSVSGEVKTVASNLDSTRKDLEASRRDLVDVRTVLSDQIAKNASELSLLRQKGEKDFFEFDIMKAKKNEMTRIADIRLELREADVKKQRYNVIIQADDNKLEKKDRLVNEPLQFLVGNVRYEIVVNKVEKDRIRGYLSTPKNKVLSAEKPALR